MTAITRATVAGSVEPGSAGRPEPVASDRLPIEEKAATVESGLARLPSLTGLRWWAALLIVFHHSFQGILGSGYVKLPAMRTWASGGFLGVSLFFVLSGFVLTWAWNPQETKQSFYVRRLARIYPLYVVSVFFFILYVAKVLHEPLSLKATLATVTLLQAYIPFQEYYARPSLVAWSLSCEAFFYALLPFVVPRLWNTKTKTVLVTAATAAAWLAIVPVVIVSTVRSGSLAHGFELHPVYRFGEFLLGICAALVMRRGWRPRWNPVVVCGLLVADYAVAATLLRMAVGHHWSIEGARFLASLVFLPGVVIAIVGLASADLRGKRTPVSNAVTVTLGEWSYAMYLTHILLLYYVSKLWKPPAGVHVGEVSTTILVVRELLIVVGAVIAAGILHKTVEIPLNRAIRARFARSQRSGEQTEAALRGGTLESQTGDGRPGTPMSAEFGSGEPAG